MTRVCNTCHVEKPIEDYYETKGKRPRWDTRCKQCELARRRALYPQQRERRQASNRQWYEANRETANARAKERRKGTERERHLRFMFNLSLDEYETRLRAQGGGCALCGKAPEERVLEVDHDHACCPGKRSCGKCVRGLLCGACNRSLAWLGDTPVAMRAALDYVTTRSMFRHTATEGEVVPIREVV